MQSFVIATRENGRFASASNGDFRCIFADVALQSLIRETQRAVAQFDRQPKPLAAPVEPLRLYSEPGRGLANGEQSVFLIRRLRVLSSKKPTRPARRPARPRIAPGASRSFPETISERAKVRAIDPRASPPPPSTRPTCILYPPFDSQSWFRCRCRPRSRFRVLLRMTPVTGLPSISFARVRARTIDNGHVRHDPSFLESSASTTLFSGKWFRSPTP